MTVIGVSGRLPAPFLRGWSWWPAAIRACHICRNGRVRLMDRWFIPRITAIRGPIAARTCWLSARATAAPRSPSIWRRAELDGFE